MSQNEHSVNVAALAECPEIGGGLNKILNSISSFLELLPCVCSLELAAVGALLWRRAPRPNWLVDYGTLLPNH